MSGIMPGTTDPLEWARATIQALRVMKFGPATISDVTVEGRPCTINLDEATVAKFWQAFLDQALTALTEPRKVPEARSEAWPNGCHKPNSCSRNRMCMYAMKKEQCRHFDRDIRPEVDAALGG